MMCSRLLKHLPAEEQSRFYHVAGGFFDSVTERYTRVELGIETPAGYLAGDASHHGTDRFTVYRGAQRLFPCRTPARCR